MTSVMKKNKQASAWLMVMIAALGLAACARGPKDVRYLESGRQHLEKKDYARAAIQFHNAIEANPRNAEAHYQLALADLARGDTKAAYRSLYNALELNPKHMEAQLKMAEVLASSSAEGDIKAAQEHARAVLNASPDNLDALDAMAVTELRLGKREEGMALLERANSKAPEHLQTAVALALSRLRQNDKTGAEQVLRHAQEKAPESGEARLVLGAFYLLSGKNQEGEQQLRKVLAKDPNNALALLDLARMFESVGRRSEAEEMYRRLATGPPSQFNPAYGSYLFRAGKQKEAIAEFERMAQLNPKDVNARTRLVAVYVAVKRTPDAQRVLDAALHNNPKDLAALLQRSELHLMAGAPSEARNDLQAVLHFTPDSAKAHFLLAQVERAQGNPFKQRGELGETLRLNPRFFAARIALAQSYITAGEGQSALDLMNHTPDDQKNGLGFIEYRNWSLLASGELKEFQTGIDEGMSKARTRGLLLQDAVLKLKQKKDAAGPLLEILKTNPEDAGALDILIRNYAAQRRIPAAIEKVRALIEQRPNSAPLRYQLGVLLASTGRSMDARAAFTAAVAANPQLLPAHLALARLDRAEDKPDAARQELEPLLSNKASEIWAREELSLIEMKSGNYVKAIEHLRKVVEADPRNVIGLNNLAYLLAEHTNQADEALKYAQMAKELAPDDVTVDGTVGWAYFQKGMYPKALQTLQDSVRREGEKVISGTAIRRYHLAMAYAKMGDKQNAIATLGTALKLDPKLSEAPVPSR
jgi:tetratricopeptide (TPR) repeat protein